MSMSVVTRASAVLTVSAWTVLVGGTLRAEEAPVEAPSARMSCATSGATYHCKGRIRTDVEARTFMPHAAVPAGYGPADLASAYGLNLALKPTSNIIAIVDAFGYPNA